MTTKEVTETQKENDEVFLHLHHLLCEEYRTGIAKGLKRHQMQRIKGFIKELEPQFEDALFRKEVENEN